MDKEICNIAVKKGYFEYLKYAHENKCPWDESLFYYEVEKKLIIYNLYKYRNILEFNSDYLKCLYYATINNCPIPIEIERDIEMLRLYFLIISL